MGLFLRFSTRLVLIPYTTDSDEDEEHTTTTTPRTAGDCDEEPTTQYSTPDEDMDEDLITDLDVLAEVTLASKPSSFFFTCAFSVFSN